MAIDLALAAERCTHKPSASILRALDSGGWVFAGSGMDHLTFRSPEIECTVPDGITCAERTYKAWRDLTFMPVGHRLKHLSGLAYAGPMHAAPLTHNATFKAALVWVLDWPTAATHIEVV